MAKLLWGLAFGPAAKAFLDAMQPGKLRRTIVKKAKALQIEPHPPGCKKLQNVQVAGEDVWRIRSGDYRILYVVREQELVIIDIDHRKDVYR
jgi:mRNA interferase RelE/StbE